MVNHPHTVSLETSSTRRIQMCIGESDMLWRVFVKHSSYPSYVVAFGDIVSGFWGQCFGHWPLPIFGFCVCFFFVYSYQYICMPFDFNIHQKKKRAIPQLSFFPISNLIQPLLWIVFLKRNDKKLSLLVRLVPNNKISTLKSPTKYLSMIKTHNFLNNTRDHGDFLKSSNALLTEVETSYDVIDNMWLH